jgi:hypothetical protein
MKTKDNAVSAPPIYWSLFKSIAENLASLINSQKITDEDRKKVYSKEKAKIIDL